MSRESMRMNTNLFLIRVFRVNLRLNFCCRDLKTAKNATTAKKILKRIGNSPFWERTTTRIFFLCDLRVLCGLFCLAKCPIAYLPIASSLITYAQLRQYERIIKSDFLQVLVSS
jgi:hypothetical protein